MAALLCVVIVAMSISGLIALLSDQVRSCITSENRLQSRWMAIAGLERAAVKLERNPAYRGETWQISAAELAPASGDRIVGEVTIRIETLAPAAGRCRISSTATYPLGKARTARTQLTVLAPLPTGDF